ncbi:unnamed protein product, partial [marine sediment metagenome]
KYRVVSAEEAGELFKAEGIKVLDILAGPGWMDVLSIPKKVRKSRHWDEKFFSQLSEMLLRLNKEPSVKGLPRHVVLYGERI